ncbi:undecaprenyldiphospho-muramoylpentapeptide beta-N-acetylglucosaminyltransferase [Gilvimarinus xylanilyticus]|uniref:UDP-N-acetylglucosamine--N-acetylmuramyl-(pentapeptide) pyrophosphoryl-undecaprenol N-acetylglucosamine transferase n=1 Tax=Gilvimarinus xylanilyticus TaxID=2944139 RepID=A0A9X2HYW6_9GAMM|nr:undecaprenyldiphospho-muramoylpentapeptide beta-N-acetylglucosaminyltransferase [Gilvimarinus xylanilyticus]MCP8900244.1 undecaprenyldiphospho-muramoylpentapeptide beta-N-acetylglucosaminyltransferase [Gilvimarinus xylanilyticus]
MSKLLIMAGGTGGHVFPALAVASELQQRGHEITWLGTRRGIEARLVPEAGIAIDYINVEGVRGKGALGKLKAPFLITQAVVQALGVLRRSKPDLVIGFGGFASGPGGLAAKLLGIPLLIHEQNAVAGSTNKILAKMARRVLTGFDRVFPQGEWVGNPVRETIRELPEPAERFNARGDEPIRLLVLGGSLGALAINEMLPRALALIPEQSRPQVRHQCGEKHQQLTASAYVGNQVQAKVEPFIGDMAGAYQWADFVICRAGALTVAELAAAGVGALLVPLPSAIDDHQTHNAAVLASAGAGISVPQRDLTPEHLAQLLQQKFSQREQLLALAQQARRVHRGDAAAKVADVAGELLNG